MDDREALEKAKQELAKCIYYSECGANAGIQSINSRKAEWLATVIHLAERGLETGARRA